MARKRASKKAPTNGTQAAPTASEAPVAAATKITKKARVAPKKTARKSAGKKRAARKASPSAKKATKRTSARQHFTPAERQQILAAAKRESLTGAQVSKKFGISQVTYYLWRKKAKSGGGADGTISPRNGRRKRAEAVGTVVGRAIGGAVNLTEMIRKELRGRIQEMLPGIIQDEVSGALAGGRRRK